MGLCFGVLDSWEILLLFNVDVEAHPQRTMKPGQILFSSPTLSSSSAVIGCGGGDLYKNMALVVLERADYEKYMIYF